MKDLPHHVKKLNKKVLRSLKHEQEEEEAYNQRFRKEETGKQKKKKAKQSRKKAHEEHAPESVSPDEQSNLLKNRPPVMKRTDHQPPAAK